jgi:hypothetical protein
MPEGIFCGERSGWCGVTSAHKETSSGKYDCKGKLITWSEQIINSAEHKGLSKAEVLWKLEPK